MAYLLSLIISALMAGVSLVGLLYPSAVYPTVALRQSFMANDVVNLGVGLPILLGSLWLSRGDRSRWERSRGDRSSRDKLVGLLLWPGALLYVLYNYIAYLFAVPPGLVSIIYLVLILFSALNLIILLRDMDINNIHEHLSGAVPAKLSGWVLLVFGGAFFLRAINMLAQSLALRTMLPLTEVGVLVADLVVSILWMIGGVLLLRKHPLGYTSGLGLLFAACMLFLGLIAFLLLQPVVSGTSFALVDVIVVSIMALVCFIPFFLFLRGVLSKV